MQPNVEAKLYLDGKIEIGRIDITEVGRNFDGTVDYAVEFGVDRIGAIGLHSRVVLAFPAAQYNVLALLKQALETLSPKELELEQPRTSDMEWEVRGIGDSFPRQEEDS